MYGGKEISKAYTYNHVVFVGARARVRFRKISFLRDDMYEQELEEAEEKYNKRRMLIYFFGIGGFPLENPYILSAYDGGSGEGKNTIESFV